MNLKYRYFLKNLKIKRLKSKLKLEVSLILIKFRGLTLSRLGRWGLNLSSTININFFKELALKSWTYYFLLNLKGNLYKTKNITVWIGLIRYQHYFFQKFLLFTYCTYYVVQECTGRSVNPAYYAV